MGLKGRFELRAGYIIHSIYRLAQFFLAITVCALYGINFNHNDSAKGKRVYAEVTAGLSAITAILYLIPQTSRIPYVFIWDVILFVLWIVLFAIFASMYITKDTRTSTTTSDGTALNDDDKSWAPKMRYDAWIVLTNAICWLISATGMSIYWFFRKRRSMFTGRATV